MAVHTVIQPQTDEKGPLLFDLDINGVTPFLSASDTRDDCLAQAHALLTLLVTAYDDSEIALNNGASGNQYSGLDELRCGIKAKALEGISTLIALAQHCSEHDYFQRQRRAA